MLFLDYSMQHGAKIKEKIWKHVKNEKIKNVYYPEHYSTKYK